MGVHQGDSLPITQMNVEDEGLPIAVTADVKRRSGCCAIHAHIWLMVEDRLV